MAEIKILHSDQGKGVYKTIDESWEYLLKIRDAEITENDHSIIISTTDGKEMVANKSHIYANNENFITYRIKLEYGGGWVLLLSKFKKIKNTFELKGYDDLSFKIRFLADTKYNDIILDDPTFKPEFTKMQFLNNQELPILFQGLRNNLFAKPNQGYLLFEAKNGGGNLYFDKNYYVELRGSIEENYRLGNFANSNAEPDWMNLKDKIEKAQDISSPNTDSFSIYPVSK